ncbi:MAG: hypothetical protein ACLFNA_09365 [Halochromatium sp.]|uniref:hypothetical protein n=1 Tax=Halochromatium sp. TaxID=2049430 RepID=UPI00397D858E
MSFDALTVGGLLVALLSGGFLIGLVWHNDRVSSKPSRPGDERLVAMTSQDR